MTVETTIQKMFDEYPDLFATRADCLNHLLCTVGNGYKWKWGQLVDRHDDDKDTNEQDYLNPAVTKAKQSEKNIVDKIKDDKELWDLKHENDLEDGLPDIGPYVPSKHHWYPLSKCFSALLNVPDDVKPDWKAAIEECKALLAADGIDISQAR